MLPKKEKYKKGLFSLFSKNKEKKKNDLKVDNSPEEVINNSSSAELGETSIPKTQSISNKASRTILLIGSTGKGKSTLANVITGMENKFKEGSGSTSETREIQKEEFIESNSGVNYIIIDTVGIGDTKLKKEEVLGKISEAVYLAREGISQIFFVIGRKFDQHEMANYDLLRAIIFDEKVVNHTTIARTHFKDFEDEKKHQIDVELMINEGGKLAGIIKSCQKRVVHVDNPSLNLVPADVADNDKEKEEKKTNEKIEYRKRIRNVSREVLLKHLEQVCQESPSYQPPKLQKLSTEISDYMEQRIKKRKELEEKRKKLGLEKKKKQEDIKMIDNLYQIEQDKVNSSIEQVEQKEKDGKEDKNEDSKILAENNKTKSVFVEKNNQDFKINQINFKERIKRRISKLKEEIKELEEAKKLKEEIKEKEEAIRKEVLKHIFNNYNEIIEVSGGDIFINSIFGNNIDLSKAKNKDYNFDELLRQWKELEKNSEDKEDLMILSLKEIETETKKKEEELVKLNKELLNDEEIFKEWQNEIS